MKKKYKTIVLLLSGALGLATGATAAEGNDAHQQIKEYQGTGTCLACHPEAAKQVAASIHYQLRARAKNVENAGADAVMGMSSEYCGLPASQASINWLGVLQPQDSTKPPVPAGCGTCHAGLGAKPNPPDKLTEADYNNIDCLICHGPNYRRTVIKEESGLKQAPAADADLLAVVRNVRKPTSEMCLRCHAKAGGGPNFKHGVVPTPSTDVHMSKGMDCVACHQTREHRIAGASDLKGAELPEVKLTCAGCHGLPIHKNLPIIDDSHLKRLDCKVCHVPAIARDATMPTVVKRDWSKPALNEKTGLFGPQEEKATNVTPVYLWWNGLVNKYPPGPKGSREDARALIYPWKKTEAIVPVDEQTAQFIPIKVGLYFMKGDLEAAVNKGMEDAKLAYSGKYKLVTDVLHYSVNHQIASRSEALSCDACHSENGRLDFAALGYSPDEDKRLRSIRTPLTAPTISIKIQ